MTHYGRQSREANKRLWSLFLVGLKIPALESFDAEYFLPSLAVVNEEVGDGVEKKPVLGSQSNPR